MDARLRTAAAYLFILPLLTAGVARDAAKAEVVGMALLAFAWVVVYRLPLPHRAMERIFATFAALVLVVIGYLAFRSWPTYFGTTRQYDVQAALWVVTWVTVAVFAVLFFDAAIFERVMWRGCTAALWVAIGAWALSFATGHTLLVNPAYGAVRMQGTLSEPSAWAPLLPVVVLLGLRRRSWLNVAAALAALVLVQSPACLLVMGLSLAVWAALASPWRHRMALLAVLAVVIPASVLFVQQADPQPWLNSGNPIKIDAGRLMSGILYVETGGSEGTNDHYASAPIVAQDARDGGWMRLGAGAGADEVYFAARYPASAGAPVQPNALWESVLFDFGEAGVAVLAVLLAVTLWRVRRFPVMAAIAVPFIAASLLSSAEGPFTYSFPALALFAYGVGWSAQDLVVLAPPGHGDRVTAAVLLMLRRRVGVERIPGMDFGVRARLPHHGRVMSKP